MNLEMWGESGNGFLKDVFVDIIINFFYELGFV